jgi:hypothetical protein
MVDLMDIVSIENPDDNRYDTTAAGGFDDQYSVSESVSSSIDSSQGCAKYGRIDIFGHVSDEAISSSDA